MKKIKIISAFVLTTLFLVGCEDNFLQDGSLAEGPITAEQNWSNDIYARGILNNAYFSLPERFNLDGNGAMQASGTDEAINSNLNSSINIFNNGTWSPVKTVDDLYSSLYEGLRVVNLFLENVGTAGIITQPSELSVAVPSAYEASLQGQVDRLRGQALFLRAYFHFELLERYGSIVLAKRVFNRDENLNLPRNTFQECVDYIVADCNEAITLLPLNTAAWSSGQRGRATKTAAMALKSRLLLYAASPQYNISKDLTKWQTAADAAKVLIDLGTTVHNLLPDYRNPFLFGGNPYNAEVIFETQTPNRNDIEQNNAPVSYDGALGRTNPTQELVDAFEMKTTGRPISDALSGYNPNAPYTNRDPRLAFTIFCNEAVYKSPTKVETYIGGKDGIGSTLNATKTGYYMRKFFNDAVTWNQTSNTLSRRPWVIFRLSEIYLNYAEALNEAQGPVADVYKYVNAVRARSNVAMPALQSTNPTAAGYVVAGDKDAMRIRIQNERRVELCFEGHRFFDVRRWQKGEEFLNKPITGMRITKTGATTYSYERFTVENRVFTAKNYLYPISQSNLNRAPALGQNFGY